MMEILVVGLIRRDAGKTTLSRALIEFYSRNWKASNVQGFKPTAGNNFWFDYPILKNAMKESRLYGRDAKLLHEASKASPGIEAINPLHRLWGLRGDETEVFLLDRIFDLEEGNCLVINSEEKLPEDLEQFVQSWSSKKILVNGIQDVDHLVETHYDPARRIAFDEVKSKNDILIIESYSDVAFPMDDLDPDSVIGVAPGYIYEFSPSKFMAAHRAVRGTYLEEGRREVLMKRITDILEPRSKVEIPALSEEVRRDQGSLLEAYSEALDLLNLPKIW